LALPGAGGPAPSACAWRWCSPAAPAAPAQTAPAPQAAGEAEWDRVLAAAKQEGVVSVVIPPGDGYRRVYEAFQNKYGIRTELMAGAGQADLVPKLSTERGAGQYLWDVAAHSPSMIFQGLKEVGALDPLRPAFIRPDVVDDSKWINGFDAGWADIDKSVTYTYVHYLDYSMQVNREVVPEAELNRLDQVWDPKWKGRVAWLDPKIPSGGARIAGTLMLAKGEDRLRALYLAAEPITTRDRRQIAEWVIRGRYPIGVGVDVASLTLFRNEGLKIDHIQPLRDDADPGARALSSGTGGVGLMNRAPHPNAAKVLINWLLSQEGQAIFSQQAGYNSRRTDVPPAEPPTVVEPGRKYLDLAIEENWPTYVRALELSNEVLK
jgi:iron(III) transport system substrate-binding protein